jgi:hypothetical protein
MTITKQQWTIIGVVITLIAIWYFFLRKKKTESGYKLTNALDSQKMKMVNSTLASTGCSPFLCDQFCGCVGCGDCDGGGCGCSKVATSAMTSM